MAGSSSSSRRATTRRIVESIFAGGALVALAGTLASNGFGYFGGESDRAAMLHVESCKRAIETVNDESLSPALSPGQAKMLVDAHLLAALRCAKDQ